MYHAGNNLARYFRVVHFNLCACMCMFIYMCMHVCVYVHIKSRGQPRSDITPQELINHFFKNKVSHWPSIHQLG